MSERRLVIVGLDGMPFGLMKQFGQSGIMPNFGALVSSGVFRRMLSSIPEVSSVAWSSIITGTNPGVHGVYGFTDIAPSTYRTTFPNFGALKAAPFWERESNGRSIIINVPMTFPARAMNGVLIAGFVALDLERATYPRSLIPMLHEMDYRVDVDSQKVHQSLEFFLRDLDKTLEARIEAYRYLWQEEWNTFALVFTGTDRLAHFLWDAYEDRTHKHRQAFLDHFRKIDRVIGEIVQNLQSDDVLLMLSDHGFERLETNVYVNYLLWDGGYLSFEEGGSPGLKSVSFSTRAFALDPGRIYVNLEEKYPRGGVKPGERETIVDELVGYFGSLEKDGKKVFKRVYRAEQLYEGPQVHRAPDIVLLGNSGYNLRGNWRAEEPFGMDVFSGKHSQDNAFLLVYGNGANVVVPKEVSVVDVVEILDAMCEV